MGQAQVAAADSYLSYKNGVLGGEHMCFTQFPVTGLATSFSANSRVTDSSAAGTAIASGIKTNNGWLGVDPEEVPTSSMAFDFHEMGYKVAITSSVPVNHATPASFYAAARSRGDYHNISMQIPDSGFEFFSGSGFLDYYDKNGENGTGEKLAEAGYTICYGQEEYDAAKAEGKDKIVLVPAASKGTNASNYTVGHSKSDITLKDVVTDAIDFFGDKAPFFVMCEGGEIDWACHSNQTMPMISDIFRMDEAVKVAYEFYQKHPKKTLIVITADHETGGISLGANGKYKVDWEKADEIWNDETESYETEMTNEEINAAICVGWTSKGHTGSPVPVYAVGKGAEKFSGVFDNTDIIKKILCR
ncbi:MAG: alkaline phosphatase [Bacteroidales bacterium]|nr:alkaline phosphatase [Bacteroidales bacterium]